MTDIDRTDDTRCAVPCSLDHRPRTTYQLVVVAAHLLQKDSFHQQHSGKATVDEYGDPAKNEASILLLHSGGAALTSCRMPRSTRNHRW